MKRLIVFLTIVSLPFFYCTLDFPEDPKAPKWDVEIEKIPLLKADTLRLGEQLDEDDFKRNGSDSILSIDINEQTQFDLKDILKSPAQQKSFTDQLGEIKVNVTQFVESEIGFAEIYPGLSSYLGTNTVVPETQITPVEKGLELPDFESISVKSGGIILELTNQLGFAFDGDMKLDVIDEGRGNSLVQTINLERIENGQTANFHVDLSGKIISNRFKGVLYGTLKGSNGQEVFISINSGLLVKITPESIVVNEATARLPIQGFDLSGSADVNLDSLRIRRAKIASGFIKLIIFNEFDFGIELNISTPNIVDNNNNQMSRIITITEHSEQEIMFILDNTTIDLDAKNLEFDIEMTILPEPDRMYTIKSTDELSVDIEVSEIRFESITGDFDISTQFPEIHETIFEDAPEDIDNFKFHDVILKVGFIESPFVMELDINITAMKDGISKQLPIVTTLSQNEELVLSRTGINNDYSSPTFVDLINLLPEEIIIEGNVRVKGQNVTFSKDDQIGVNYGIDFPLIFSANQASFSQNDTLEIEDDMRDFLRDNSMSAGITMSVENGLPISGELSLLVGPDSTNISSTIVTINLPKPILTSGVVTTPGVTTININLDQPRFLAIANANFYQFAITIDDISEAAITAKNYLIVHDVFISGSFLFDPEGLADDENNGNN
jgi:hypothetical protein